MQTVDPGQNFYFAILVPQGLHAVVLLVKYQGGCAAVGWMTSKSRGYKCVPDTDAAWEFLHEVFGEEVEFRETTPPKYRQFQAMLRPRSITPSKHARVHLREHKMPTALSLPPVLPLPYVKAAAMERVVQKRIEAEAELPIPPAPPEFVPSFPMFDIDSLPRTRPTKRR